MLNATIGYYIIVDKTDNNQDTNLIEHNNIIINVEIAAMFPITNV